MNNYTIYVHFLFYGFSSLNLKFILFLLVFCFISPALNFKFMFVYKCKNGKRKRNVDEYGK